jgi:hypothetical protein
MVTLQAPIPEQAPLQPVKFDVAFGLAVRVTVVPLTKLAEHMLPQLIPDGVLVTLPLPLPASVIERGKSALNVAVTEAAAFILTVHVPVPEHAPLQPVKFDVAFEAAVRVTPVPGAKLPMQELLQFITGG